MNFLNPVTHQFLGRFPLVQEYQRVLSQAAGVAVRLVSALPPLNPASMCAAPNQFLCLRQAAPDPAFECPGMFAEVQRRVSETCATEPVTCPLQRRAIGVPVVCAGRHLATWVLGPMRSLEQLPLEAEALVQALNQCGLGESKSQAEAAWLAMPSVSDDQISGIRSLLALFAVQLETYSQRNWTAGNIEQRRLVWAAKHYLRQHLDRPFALREAAREAGASQRHLQGAFQAVSGVTPREHLSSLRIERAKILLLTSTESISAVAAACGYRSASSFSRTFSQKTRTTPSRYRALAGRASNLNGLVRTAC